MADEVTGPGSQYSFWNPDPAAEGALQRLSDKYSMQAAAAAGTYGGGGGAPGAVPGQDPAYDAVKPLPGQPTVSGWQGGQYFFPHQESQITRPTRTPSRPYSVGRRATGGGTAAAGTTSPVIPEPTYQAPAAPTLPGFTAREYAPPEEDPGFERAKRREFMGAGQRELRQRTQEAIVGARSLANPAARKDFVRSTLAGFGEGLEKVSRGASASAMSAARAKRAEQLRTYDANYRAKTQADKVNYENTINQMLTDYRNKVWGAQQAYGVQRAAYLAQPQSNIAATTQAAPLTAIQKARKEAGLPVSYNRPAPEFTVSNPLVFR